MNSTLQRNFERLQSETKLLLKEVSALSSNTYHHKPGEGRWSISQILTHLLTSERMSLDYMKKKALGVDQLENSGVVEYIKFLLLKLSQRIPFKYEAPRKVVEQTPSPLSYGDLVRKWEVVRIELRDFLEGVREENLRKKIYRHPRAGLLDVNHALQFLTEHLRHHHPQIQTIIENQRKKKIEKH